MRRRIIVVIALIVIVVGVGGYLAYQPAIAPLPVAPQKFDIALIAHGAELAAIGGCASCHTAAAGQALAGGAPVPTPYGTIYSSNITPDRDTGIGRWTEASFVRAMQQGVDREGNHLYPAFPYDHFTHVSVEDDKAIYAYLMTRSPVRARPPADQLGFPYDVRPILAAWNMLFLKQGAIPYDSTESGEWNRGRYLVDGLGHCASCHTPRNSLGAEDTGESYAGGAVIDGWYVYPINETSPAPQRWTADALAVYLKTGFSADHGASLGPMAQVTANLGAAGDADVHAMATYIAFLMRNGQAPAAQTPAQPILTSGDSLAAPKVTEAGADRGATIYATACSSCHESGRLPPFGGVDFHRSTAVHADSAQNVVNMVLFGLPAAEGRTGAVMPGFAGTMSRDDVVALLTYLRGTFGDGKPTWPNLSQLVADTMDGKTPVKLYGQDGVERGPVPVNPAGASP